MNTNLQNKTSKDPVSLEVQDSNLKVNGNGIHSTSALISKGEISRETNNSIKGNGLVKGCNQTKDTTPRLQVTVEFAAKQLFQILLVDIKRRNAKFEELIPGAILI
ncbi:MAG: hypothetical protein UW51_C0006G0203 [Candidatus Amesbacteria bacterium GW2011_GWA1_44_24]|nr:MAG: hypothetical protein UW51_C0006G0203 [Candidatus Amesbacteria bacterium GW2011_GWA1_44_24]